MSETNLPLFLSDRDPIAALDKQARPVIEAMRDWRLGRLDEKDTVHFCGLVHHPENGAVVFLPREARTGVLGEDLQTASMTMRALARFGNETSKREFDDDGEAGNPSALSVIKRLADDFRDHGLFSERTRQHTKNSGKPDWVRTIKREIAMPNRKDQPIFTEICSSRATNTSKTLLAQIQAAVLREILATHGWWLLGIKAKKNELISCQTPSFPKSIWVRKLDALLPSLYSSRSVFLAEYLRFYLSETRSSTNGSFVFGVSDFHTVWETILQKVIVRSSHDQRRNWNSELPKPVYIHKNDGAHDARSRGMQTDLILEDPSGYTIVDAKYYAAKNASSAPGWPDISKQLFYEKALRILVDTDANSPTKIRNVFAFPGEKSAGPLHRVEMQTSTGSSTKISDFQRIDCVYISMRDALHQYATMTQKIIIPNSDL